MPSGITSRAVMRCSWDLFGFDLRGRRRRFGCGRIVDRLLDRLDEDRSAALTDVHEGFLPRTDVCAESYSRHPAWSTRAGAGVITGGRPACAYEDHAGSVIPVTPSLDRMGQPG